MLHDESHIVVSCRWRLMSREITFKWRAVYVLTHEITLCKKVLKSYLSKSKNIVVEVKVTHLNST